jgi:hypothetical protein
MSVIITIQGTPIEFPSSGESPNWAPAVIEFAQAVENAILSAVGPYDIAPQVFNLVSASAPDVEITDLNFPISAVRSAYIKYSIYRTTSLETVSEVGNIICVYDASKSVNNKWTVSRDYVGDAKCSFKITDDGQVEITTDPLTGTYVSGKVSFSAQALQQS